MKVSPAFRIIRAALKADPASDDIEKLVLAKMNVEFWTASRRGIHKDRRKAAIYILTGNLHFNRAGVVRYDVTGLYNRAGLSSEI